LYRSQAQVFGMLRLSSNRIVLGVGVLTLLLTLAVRAQELNLAQIRAEVPLSPLTVAIWNEQTDRVKALLEGGADPNAPGEKQQTTPWQWAVIAGHRGSLELMRDAAEVHPGSLVTPRLMWMALQRNDVNLVAQFLAAGADVEFRADGYTPLMAAAASGHVEIMRLLLERGARVDVQDQFGDTALMVQGAGAPGASR
jgi:ankyrin repeat protein